MKTPSELSEMLSIFQARKKKLSKIDSKQFPLEKKLQLIRIYLHYYYWAKYIKYVLIRITKVDFVSGGIISSEEIKECYIVEGGEQIRPDYKSMFNKISRCQCNPINNPEISNISTPPNNIKP